MVNHRRNFNVLKKYMTLMRVVEHGQPYNPSTTIDKTLKNWKHSGKAGKHNYIVYNPSGLRFDSDNSLR